MPFWNNYINTNPEVDDDDLPLLQHRLIDDNGNQRACAIPEEWQLLSSIRNLNFVRSLRRKTHTSAHLSHYKQQTHSGRHSAKKSSPFAAKRRAEIVSSITKTITSPFKYVADRGRRSLSSISSLTNSLHQRAHLLARSVSRTRPSHSTHTVRKTARSNVHKRRGRSPVNHKSNNRNRKTSPSRSSSASVRPSSLSPSSSSEKLSSSPVEHHNLSPMPSPQPTQSTTTNTTTATKRHQHSMTSSPQPKKPEQTATPSPHKRTRHSSTHAERSRSSSSKITPVPSHTTGTPCNEWSVSSLREYAKQHHISITGLRNKNDIVNAITCATLHEEQ